ncbi:uncharacterized protein G2W53_009906 [Senna tora]|uniref:Uncharacterized protein n=1 Tax=Senna tora TaxID=362788 RepID=A0A834WZR7_9FABA|nr:uncharacterized protein G2W53_009906 [Senna tora]
MLRHDPRPSHAMTTAIGASKPLWFLRSDPDFVIRNKLRHDPRPSHDMTTAIGASNPLRFANTTRTDVFHTLAQQVFCIVIREVSEIRPRYVMRNMLRHDPRPSHAMTTPIGLSKPLRFTNTTRTKVFHSLAQQAFCLVVSEIRPRFVIRNMLRHDPRPSHAMTTAIGASKPLRFANTTRTDVFHTLAQQVFCIVIREASNPLRFANTTRVDVFHSFAQQVFCIVIGEGF